MDNLTFQWPWVLAGLLLVPWLPDWLPRAITTRRLVRVMHPDLLRLFSLSRDAGRASGRVRWTIRLMGVCTLLALAGPSLPVGENQLRVAPRPLIIALDLSLSMYARDIAPSRIERARQKIQDILDRTGDRPVGLIAYAGDAFSVVPVTRDHASIELMLPDLSPAIMPLPGSRLDRALQLAHKWAGRTGQADILIVADDLPATHLPAVSRALRDWPGRRTLLAMGTDAGAPIPIPGRGFLQQDNTLIMAALPVRRLEQLASEVGVIWERVTLTDTDIDTLLSRADIELNRSDIDGPLPPRNLGYWLLLPVLLLALTLIPRLAIAGSILLLTSIVPAPSHAFETDALWYNRDQRAWQAFQQQRFDEAARLAEDPMLRGSALYRAGQYAKAAEAFAEVPSAEGHYNRGNALAQAGKIAEARKAYQRALALNPGLEQARRNLELLDQLQPQSAPQSGGDSGDPSGQPSANSSGDPASREGRSRNEQGGQSKGHPNATRPSSAREPAASDEGAHPQQPGRNDQGAPSSHPPGGEGTSNTTPPQPGAGDEASDRSTQTSQQFPNAKSDAAPEAARGKPQPDGATEVWLRRIPDTPGVLLQRKFQLHARERGRRPEKGEPIW